VPIAIYLAINADRSSASGWGTAMSTDTAFALGVLALVGPGVPDRVRTYLLTFALVDDVAGIVVIALAYSGHIDLTALVSARPGAGRSSNRPPTRGPSSTTARSTASMSSCNGNENDSDADHELGIETSPRQTRAICA
jgi:hypothetical protein